MSAARAAIVTAVLSVASSAHAQITPLSGGWNVHARVFPSGVEDIACGTDRAYVRNWFGDVARWDGTWSTLPRRGHAMYGRSLGVTPDGQVFLEASGGIAQWTGSVWIDHVLDRWEGDVDSGFAAPSASEVYYVGRGRIARFDGTRFGTYDAGTWRALTAVALAGDDLLIAGQGGTIMRRHGATWTRESTGIETWIRGLAVFAADDVWAFGDGPTWQSSTVLRFDGRAWTRQETGLTGAVTDVGGARGRPLAVGAFGVAVWSGTAWTIELAETDLGEGYHNLVAVCATDGQEIVADAGGHALIRAR